MSLLSRSSFRRKPESSVFAFACFVFKSKGFHSSSGRAAYFLCSCKESRQRNTPQRLAPFGHPARKVRVSGRVPPIAHPVQQRNRRDPSRRPLRGLIARCRRKAMGPREEQSARVLRAEAKSRSEAALAFALAVLLILLEARRMRAPLTGPLCRGERTEEKPAGARPRWARVRCWSRDGPSTNPVVRSRSRWAGAQRPRHRGGLSFGYFSLATQRKVTRPPQADGSPCL